MEVITVYFGIEEALKCTVRKIKSF